jgi:hypothetical protein
LIEGGFPTRLTSRKGVAVKIVGFGRTGVAAGTAEWMTASAVVPSVEAATNDGL